MLHICPQLGVKILADSNSWNVNGTPNLRNAWQMLTVLIQVTSGHVFAQPSVLFCRLFIKIVYSSRAYQSF